jgi:hypothetical protein
MPRPKVITGSPVEILLDDRRTNVRGARNGRCIPKAGAEEDAAALDRIQLAHRVGASSSAISRPHASA